MLNLIRRTFLNKQLDFRVRLFNVLAMAGMLISLIITIAGLFTGAGMVNTLANLASALLSFGLLYYSYRSGNYRACYIVTVVVIFMIGFPMMFFSAGGYHSGMPAFFVFAVLFTIFMLDGKGAFVLSAVELLIYLGCCLYAYFYPESVIMFSTEADILTDVIIGFMCVSVSLGITMFLHFRMYNEQQRQLESARKEAVRLSEIKTTFLANMSHEIRTPINVILGMNEMVLRQSESEQLTGFARNIQNAGKTLLTLINNILDVSKIESGKMEVLEETYLLADLMRDLYVIGSERAAEKGLNFVLEAAETLPSELQGDFIHIKQIAVNFLSNAVKYTKEGTVALRLTSLPGGAPHQTILRILVADTGIGIREEDQAALFEAFTRVDLPTHRNIEGTGLGLAIAKQLADLMDGRISVHSVWGKGSTFAAELPQTVFNAAPIGKNVLFSPMSSLLHEESFIAPEGRILAIDDNKENLEVVKELLRRTLLTVDTASSGFECLEKLETGEYHALLLDYMMPDMDGIETLHRIKSSFPAFSAPVIALTANAVSGAEEMFLREGFSDYLSKPIVWKDLEDKLMRCLPASLVEKSAPLCDRAYLSIRESLSALLASYDVTLNEGLKYLGGNLKQYLRLAGFFVESCAASRAEAEAFLREKNWQGLLHPVHSLKSKAKALGAAALHDTAARLEKRCMLRDEGYISAAMPLLYLQWKRAADGLNAALLQAGSLKNETVKSSREAPPTAGELLAAIRAFRRAEAESALTALLASAPHEQSARLAEVRDAVNALDFDKAEELLLPFVEA